MKKLFFIALACMAFHLAGQAQNARFGFTAGTSIANYKWKYPGMSISGDSKAGITAGILADVPMSSSFSIQPALNFVQKGYTSEFLGDKETVSINCLEVPVNFLYKTGGNAGSFFVGAGPSFAFNMSGKYKYDDGTPDEDLSFGNDQDNDYMKSLDAGINFLAGYEFSNGLLLSAGYNQGLSNLSLYTDDDESTKSNYFSIKIGFMFGKRK
ncbi:MAG TPA: porin family protein [Chitinophagaceae bacterium]|nr:porin family protein [Chitinophagaceae bacterium]